MIDCGVEVAPPLDAPGKLETCGSTGLLLEEPAAGTTTVAELAEFVVAARGLLVCWCGKFNNPARLDRLRLGRTLGKSDIKPLRLELELEGAKGAETAATRGAEVVVTATVATELGDEGRIARFSGSLETDPSSGV